MSNQGRAAHEPDARMLRPWNGRLGDEQIRREFLAICRKKCKTEIENFLACSKEQGLMVVFRCREQNKEMNGCLRQYTATTRFIRSLKPSALQHAKSEAGDSTRSK